MSSMSGNAAWPLSDSMNADARAAVALLDKISPADVCRLVDVAAAGHLKSAKALRNALQLPVSVQRIQQLLASADFQARVRQERARRRRADNAAASRGHNSSGDSARTAGDDDGDDEEDDDDYYDEYDGEDDDDAMDGHASSAASGVNDPDNLPLGVAATVTAPDGSSKTLQVHQKFPTRTHVRHAVRDFTAVQRKSVVIHKESNGGSNFTYICKSPTPCTFFVKVRRLNRRRSTVHMIVALSCDHSSTCTGKPLKAHQVLKPRVPKPTCAPATVTLHDGSTLTLRERMEFPSREAVKDFVHDFALAQGKRARVDRVTSGGNNITFLCTSATPCPFKVRTLRSKPSGRHIVKAFDVTHGPECTGKPAVTKRQVLKQLTKMEATPTLMLSGADVQAMVKSVQGVDVTQRVASDARCELVGRVLRDATAGIQKLESLLAHFEALNATAKTQIEFDMREHTFKRAFLQLPFATDVQRQSMRVLGLTVTEMAPASNLRGLLFELVTKDGNSDVYTLAVGLCASPMVVNESYVWFLSACVSSGITFDVPLVCDRNSAMLSAAATLAVPFTLIQCTYRVLVTLEERLQRPVPPDARALVLQAQDADTSAEYKHVLAALRTTHPDVAAHLEIVDATTWAKHKYMQQCALFNSPSASLVLPVALPATIVAARELGPFELFQSYMERCMKAWYDGKRNAKTWTNAGRKLTVFADHALRALERDARGCRVVPSDDERGIAYVSADPSSATEASALAPTKCRVNLESGSCTCPALAQRRLPCKHVVAAAHFFNADGGTWDVSRLCDALYSAAQYASVFANARPIEMPVEEELVRNTRIKVIPTTTSNRCSLCHGIGHNRRRCPNPPAPSDSSAVEQTEEQQQEEEAPPSLPDAAMTIGLV